MTGGQKRLSRAAALLRDVLASQAADAATVAHALAVDVATIDAFVSGQKPMPLDAQNSLATFVIDKTPELARDGHRLRAQVSAAQDYEDGRTATHHVWPRWR
ncbi:MAG TPA: hypothetical protein VKH19_12085 [Gemmatimonadaceae bacterium]|nr:hypothetical protein [Gemmatimonadaceae bacterium]